MSSITARPVILVLVVTVLMACAQSVMALPTPSKTAVDQSLAERAKDLATVQQMLDQPEVAAALAAQGLTEDQIHLRLAQLSPEELHSLSSQIEMLHAAGAGVPTYIWILIGVLIGVLILGAII